MHAAVGTNYKQQDTKRPTTQLPLLRFPSTCSVLGMIPAQGMGRPLGHHSPQSPGPGPALIHLKNQLAAAPAATPYPMEGVRGPVTFLSPVVAGVPIQLCLNFSSGLFWPHQFLLI